MVLVVLNAFLLINVAFKDLHSTNILHKYTKSLPPLHYRDSALILSMNFYQVMHSEQKELMGQIFVFGNKIAYSHLF